MERSVPNEIRVTPSENPFPIFSFGDIGRFVDVQFDSEKPEGAKLAITFSQEDLGWVDPATLRIFEVDRPEKMCTLVEDSVVVLRHRFVYGRIEHPGTYALIGLPRERHVAAAVLALKELTGTELARRKPAVCERILCGQPFLKGDLIPPGGVGGDVCTFCLGLEPLGEGLPEKQIFELPRRPLGSPFFKIPEFVPAERIVFESNLLTHPRKEIFVIGASGGQSVRLTNLPSSDEGNPHWSPDGKKIAFSSNQNGLGAEIWIMDEDGKNLINLSNHSAWGVDDHPDWSPAGNQLCFSHGTSSGYEIWTMDTSGTNVVSVTSATGQGIGDLDPEWSVDDLIAFSSDRTGTFHIYVVDAAGGTPTQLTSGTGASHYDPAWSPDGKWIAFNRREHAPGYSNDLWLMDKTGGTLQQLTNRSASNFGPTFSPDGKGIAFSSNYLAGGIEIWLLEVANPSNLTRLTSDGFAHVNPDWGPPP